MCDQDSSMQADSPASCSAPACEYWVDAARAMSTVAVVLLHFLGTGVLENETIPVAAGFLAGLSAILSIIGRFAVPVFLLITGYLLLDGRRSLTPFKLWRYLRRAVGALLVFGFFFALIKAVGEGTASISDPIGLVTDALWRIVTERSFSHLWYLYALTGIYLLLPMLKRFAISAERWEWHVVLVSLFIFTLVVKTLNIVFDWRLFVALPVGSSSLFYVLMGGYAHRFLRQKSLSRSMVAGLCAAVINAAMCFYWVSAIRTVPQALFDPENPLIALWAIALFQFVRFRAFKGEGAVSRAIRSLSMCSLGVYLIHPVFVQICNRVLGITVLTASPMVLILAFVLVLYMSWGATLLLKQVPGIRSVL